MTSTSQQTDLLGRHSFIASLSYLWPSSLKVTFILLAMKMKAVEYYNKNKAISHTPGSHPVSLMSRPQPSYEEKGLVTIGCAESAAMIPNKPMK